MSPDKKRVLMVHRTAPGQTHHKDKFSGLGGKMERDEDVATCMVREIREEAGIEVVDMTLKGTINWTGFGAGGEDWLGFIFRIDSFEGTPSAHSPEGPLEWIEIERIPTLPMWEGDKHFLGMVFDDSKQPFHGFMPYEDGRPVDWKFVR